MSDLCLLMTGSQMNTERGMTPVRFLRLLDGRYFESTTEIPNSVGGPKILVLPTLSSKDFYNVQRRHHALDGLTPSAKSARRRLKVVDLN